MASGVRDLDQDPGYKLIRVDPLVFPWLRRVVSALDSCGREYTVSGVSVAPGTETEAPARFRCECGGWLSAFIPGSVNKERLVLTPKGPATLA